MTERDLTAQWFDPMPKSLKLMYIASNPECDGGMHHYQDWDVKALTFYDMMSTTQRVLIKAFKELRPENT